MYDLVATVLLAKTVSLTDPKTIAMLFDGLWQTLYITLLSTLLAYIAGLPLGVLLVVTSKNGIKPVIWLNKILGVVINLLRSVPFLILLILVIPITRAVVGTSIGTNATVVPLFIASFAFIARLVEASLLEVDGGIIEAAWSMGSSPFQIIRKVLLPEAKSSLINGAAIAVVTILGYSAMSGIVGGGGLGDLAIRYGYYRYQKGIMFVSVALIVIIVQILQLIGEKLTKKTDKRLRIVASNVGFGGLGFGPTFGVFKSKDAEE
jgi:D-methionine transport system permease protein